MLSSDAEFHKEDQAAFEPQLLLEVKACTKSFPGVVAFNKVDFDPVKTDGIKIEIKLQQKLSAGIQEVIIE